VEVKKAMDRVILKPHVSNMKMWETAFDFTGSRPASTRSTGCWT
jgi:hypothetical protein